MPLQGYSRLLSTTSGLRTGFFLQRPGTNTAVARPFLDSRPDYRLVRETQSQAMVTIFLEKVIKGEPL